jgi:hypothetical protein
MNVFRSLARNVVSFLDVKGASQPEPGAKTLNAVRQQRVPGVLGLSRFRDGFEQFPQGAQGALRTLQAERAYRPTYSAPLNTQRDGFDGGRRSPVDLSGGVKPAAFHVSNEAPVAAQGFSASLEDLASLF